MEQRKFLAMVGPLAQADMQKSGILASLTIAQAILESGWGASELATKANALFGIKADARWSGKAYSKDTKSVTTAQPTPPLPRCSVPMTVGRKRCRP